MKYFIFIVALLAIEINAQTTLNFDKRVIQCEDKWVAFSPKNDSSYLFGFIYFDEQAGLTLNLEGTFKILSNGVFVPKKTDSTPIKIRLEPNDVLVAFIPESKFQELEITAIPEWLEIYKSDTNSIARLYRWGYLYNSWNECGKALTYLEKAENINPKHEGLAVELAFSYNCLKQYEKAEAVLAEEIRTNTEDAYVLKEYIFTLTKINKIDIAVKQFNKSIQNIKDNPYIAENCFNILQYYYKQNDKENFNEWYNELQKHPSENKSITHYADRMKKEINQ